MFVTHVAYITLIMRLSSNKAWSQLNDKLLHVLASPSRDGKNNSSYKPFNKHTKLCIHRVLNARATILFLSGAEALTICLVARLRLDSEVELQENKCVNSDLLTAHTPPPGLLKGLQTPAAVVDEKTGSQVIRNQFDLC